MDNKHAARLASSKVQADERAAQALNDLPTYTSVNPALSADMVADILKDVRDKRKREQSARQVLNVAYDELVEAEWLLHDTMQGVKQQATAQYGANSSEIEALGVKRKVDRKKRGPNHE